jgi:hypothetical protein
MSLTQHIALVPEAGGINASELARVCAALQKQLTRDLAPMWGINATINAFPHLEDVPLGYWPIIITFCELGDQAGVHIDKNGQPYAQVEMSPGWSLHASQACLDMLINPFARKLVAGPSPRPDQGPVEFLLEIGAPCNDPDSAYVIDDVLVSDFCTPAFWGSSAASDHSYSFTGALHTPHQVMPGGHLTWHDPITDKWWLRHHLNQTLVDTRLGALDGRIGVVREAMRLRAPQALRAEKMTVAAFEARLGVRRQHALQASQFQAHRLRTLVVGTSGEVVPELESRGAVRTVEMRNENRRRQLLTTPQEQEEEGLVEVNQNELLDATQVPRDAWSPTPGPTDQLRSSPQEPPRTKTTPPPLPVEEHRPPAAAAQAPPSTPQVPVLQTPVPQPPTPRAAPLPPPRVPDRPAVAASTVPPISMKVAATKTPSNSSGWLLAASAIAGAATVLLAIVLYGRASSSIDGTPSASTHAASPPAAAATAAAQAPTATTVAVPVAATPPAPPPTVIATTAPAAAPVATAVAAPSPLPAAPPPAAVAPPAPTNAVPTPAVAPAPAAPAAVVTAAPVATVAAIAAAAPAAAPVKVVRPRAAAPVARPAPAPAPAAPAPAPRATDESDPLEGLIGERR